MSWDRVEPCKPGELFEIIAKKYDGTVTFRWDSRVVDSRGDLCIFSMPKGTQIHSRKRGTYSLSTNGIFYLDRHKWFNIAVHADDQKRILFWYCNVAMPPEFGSSISYVDLDLDIQVRPDLGFEILDRDEYVSAVQTMGYPDWMQERAEGALEELTQMIARREFPFGFAFGAEPPQP